MANNPQFSGGGQYHDDKTRIKDAMKLGKITMVSTWTFEDFKGAISDDVGSPPISDINFKLLYEEIVERAKEKEGKEAKKQQRLTDDFTKLLYTFKEVIASSNWEDCKQLFEESQEYRSIGEESLIKEIFEECHTLTRKGQREGTHKHEEEKARKEKDREEKDKRKERERKEEREKEKEKEHDSEKGKERTKKDETDSENVDASDGYGHKEDKKREKEKDRKHRKRHQSATGDTNSDKDGKEESKKSRRHSSDRKKSRKHAYTPESDGESHESRQKRHKRDNQDGSHRNGGYGELEDGEIRKQPMAAEIDI